MTSTAGLRAAEHAALRQDAFALCITSSLPCKNHHAVSPVDTAARYADSSEASGDVASSVLAGAAIPHAGGFGGRWCSDTAATAVAKRSSNRPVVACLNGLLASDAGAAGAGADPSCGAVGVVFGGGKGASGSGQQHPHTAAALSLGNWGLQENAANGSTGPLDVHRFVVPLGVYGQMQQGGVVSAVVLGKRRRSSMADNHDSERIHSVAVDEMAQGDGSGAAAVAPASTAPHSAAAVLAAMAAVAAAGGARGVAGRCVRKTSPPPAAATADLHGHASHALPTTTVADAAEADASAAVVGAAAYGYSGGDNDGGNGATGEAAAVPAAAMLRDAEGAVRVAQLNQQQLVSAGECRRRRAAASTAVVLLPRPSGRAPDLGAMCNGGGAADNDVDGMAERASSTSSTAAGGTGGGTAGGGRHQHHSSLFGHGHLLYQQPPPSPSLPLHRQQHQQDGGGGLLQLSGGPRHMMSHRPAAAGAGLGVSLHAASAPVSGGQHASKPATAAEVATIPGLPDAGVVAAAGAQPAASSRGLLGTGAAATGAAGRVLQDPAGAARVSADMFEGRLTDLLRGCGSNDEMSALLLPRGHHQLLQQHAGRVAAPPHAGAAATCAATRPLQHPNCLSLQLPVATNHAASVSAAAAAACCPAANPQASAAPPQPILQQQAQQQPDEDPRSTEELLAVGREVASRLMRVQRAKETLRRMEGSLVAEARNLRLVLHQRRRQQLEQLEQQQQQQQNLLVAAAAADAEAVVAGAEAAQQQVAGSRWRSEATAACHNSEATAAAAAAEPIAGAAVPPAADSTGGAVVKLLILGAPSEDGNAAQHATAAAAAGSVTTAPSERARALRSTIATNSAASPLDSSLARTAAAAAAGAASVVAAASIRAAGAPAAAGAHNSGLGLHNLTGSANATPRFVLPRNTGNGCGGAAGACSHEEDAVRGDGQTAAGKPVTDRRISESSQGRGSSSSGASGGAGLVPPSAALLKAALAVAGIRSFPPS